MGGGGQQMRRAGAGRYGLLNVPQPVSGSDLELDGKELQKIALTEDLLRHARRGLLRRAGVTSH